MRLFVPFIALAIALPASTAYAEIYRVAEMSAPELRALDREHTAVLLPGGILEQHGPYLPSFSDGYMNERMTELLANAINEKSGWNALVFPTIPIGCGGANELGEKYSFSGTYAVRFETLRAIFMDLATELGEQGFKWIFVLHAHGAPNHQRAIDHAADYFNDTYDGTMVNLFGRVALGGGDQRTREESAEDGISIHAGMEETSMILHLRPDLVDPAYKTAQPLTPRGLNNVTEIAKPHDWPGYFGSPRLASPERGAQFFAGFQDSIIGLALKVLDGFDYTKLPRHADVFGNMPGMRETSQAAIEHDATIKAKQDKWLREHVASPIN